MQAPQNIFSFCFFINDLPRNILRTFVNIYANESKVHECALKNKDDPSIEIDLSSDLTLTAQGGKKLTCNFQYIKNQTDIVLSSPIRP